MIDSLYFAFLCVSVCVFFFGLQLSVGLEILDVQLVDDIFEWETIPTARGKSKSPISRRLICSLPF